MAKKKMLLVGSRLDTEMWQDDLVPAGFQYEIMTTMWETVKYLRNHPEEKQTPILVQENLPIYQCVDDSSHVPAAFKERAVLDHDFDRGALLIAHLRKEGLIASDSPAYLATVDAEDERYATPPEGVTKVIRIDMERNIADQIEPPLHRADERTRKRGG